MATKKLIAKKPARVAKRNVAAQNDPARKVVLASLGAVALSRKEGVRVINRIIEQGQDLRERTVKFAEGTVAGVREQVTGVIGKVQQKAAANLSQVEGVVGGQVTRVLSRLGVPSKSDVQVLSRRVADLSRQVKALQAKAA